MDQQKEIYSIEAYELLAELEEALLALEESPEDMGLIGRVFRALHTIKGSGAMLGFDEIVAFTHELETVFDLIREGKMPVSRELISLSLSSRDHILAMLDADSERSAEHDTKKADEIVAAIRKLAARER